ncbi:MAG: transcriptional regulator MraZ, partial [Solirubrobacterales bacterium]|nr:transcriptional regulator MraZ [Solirubrobacterales bacterium]
GFPQLAFRGRYEHSLDAKDRLTVPARFRAALSDGVVLFAGLDPCVELYATEDYESFHERFLSGLNPLSERGRMMRRRFNAQAEDEKLDAAGRVRIAKHLIDHASLEGPCVVVGVADHLEIWTEKAWGEHEATVDAAAGAMAEELAGGVPAPGGED